MSATSSKIEPFLARYAVNRQDGETLPGFYDEEMSRWVIDSDGGKISLVEAGLSLRELETKTRVVNEQDDTAAHMLGAASGTETAVGPEQDDANLLFLLAGTLTEVKSESDDLT